LEVAIGFQPMTPAEMAELEQRCANFAGDGRFELYKTSIKFDNPQARWPNGYPLDPQVKEIKEMFENSTGATPH
jgi:hypothetical protein